jgi:3-oxoacyl-[acyl-carrier protein] reductase
VSESLLGKTTVIFGGSGHIGWATAQRLASRKSKIIIIGRRNIDDIQNRLSTLPFHEELRHSVIYCCVKDSVSIQSAADKVQAETGRCDILINAAGVSSSLKSKNLSHLSDDIFDNIFDTNVRGTFATVRAFQSLLLATQNSLVINIASASGSGPNFRNLAYSASKAAVISLTQSLAAVLSPHVRVISISPGPLTNPVSGIDRPSDFNTEQAQKSFLQRLAEPADIATAIECCATQMTFVNGQNIIVDGGRF